MNDLRDFDRKFGLDRFEPEFVCEMGEAMRTDAADPKGLAGYLNAPPVIREAFDRAQARAIERELADRREIDEWVEAELADDPLAQAVARRRRNDRLIVGAIDGTAATEPPLRVRGIRWDAHWQRRADAARRLGARVTAPPYSRETDPLFDVDLREVWTELTGLELRGNVTRCPSPDHDDRFASCGVKARFFNCLGCKAGGSIIDLGALVFGLEPRGAGFFEIRRRLLAELGIEEAA